jgi:hypothetical protein
MQGDIGPDIGDSDPACDIDLSLVRPEEQLN